MNGIFGPLTQTAVMDFQRQHGLRVYGIVGKQTWNKLAQVTDTAQEVDLLSRLVYSESRGDPYKGQVVVAAVVLNRVKLKDFPYSRGHLPEGTMRSGKQRNGQSTAKCYRS